MADVGKMTKTSSFVIALCAGSCVGSCFAMGADAAIEGGFLHSNTQSRQNLVSQPTDQTLPSQAQSSFDSINFAIQAIAGQIDLGAAAGWIWKEGNTNRMILMQDVDVTLAQHHFLASSANVWLRKLDSDSTNGTTRYQVYAIFEDLRSADGTITMSAEQLPVRGVIEVSTPITMRLDARFDRPPELKSQAGQFLQRTNEIYAQRVLGAKQAPTADAPVRPWSTPIVNDATSSQDGTVASGANAQQTPNATESKPSQSPIFHPQGVFSIFIGGRIVIDGASSGSGSVITADGGVAIQYQDPSNNQWVDFKSERVVIYTKGNEPITGVSRFGTSQIEGIYLEGGVFAGDQQWSVRAPRMYLDVENNRALMLDTVFWTSDRRNAMPIYVRAESVRQTAQSEFHAKKARISNSAFFEPDLTIGVSDIKVTVDQSQSQVADLDDQQEPRPSVSVEGRHVTLNIGPVPVLWVPGIKGDPGLFPLEQVTIEDSNRSGTAIKTRWDAASLFRLTLPPGIDLKLELDYYADRGAGVGVLSDWETREHRGGLFFYLLFEDDGTDITASGRKINRDGETRGIFALSDVWEFTRAWTLVTELSYVSDETFVPAIFQDLARETEDFRNRIQLERQSDDSYFALELKTTLNDFIVPEYLLQSPGYQVDKIPEARYISLAQDLLADYEPGLLTYSFEARAGVMRLAFSEVSAASYGMNTNSLADDAFGTTTSQSLGDKFRALGLDESPVTRLDTRHELNARLDLGPIRVNPFAVGRITAYDDSFDAYSPGQTDNVRYWGGGGVTFSTTLQKINEDAENRFFDVHRLRHIVEPSITLWGGDSNFEAADVPIFDDDVEGLLEGTAFRAAIDQTWQTKRGGVGRWRDVDLLKLRTEYVWTSDDAGQSPIPQYYSSRPELSNPGEYLGASAIWQPTEVLAFAGEVVYDMTSESTARASIGAIIEHRPGFTTSVEYREVQPLDATFASMAAKYRISDKYTISSNVNYNFQLDDFQNFNAQLLRRFQVGSLGATIRYDNIRGVTSFGFVFRPAGSSGDIPTDPSWGG